MRCWSVDRRRRAAGRRSDHSILTDGQSGRDQLRHNMNIDLRQLLHFRLDSAALSRRGSAAPLCLNLSHVWLLFDWLVIKHWLVCFLLFILRCDGESRHRFLLATTSGRSFGPIDDV